MKHRTLPSLMLLTLVSGSATAVTVTGTFTAYGGGYDLTGHVTGYQGNGPIGGQLISGQFTLDVDAAPLDTYGSPAMALHAGSPLNWISFTINELSFAGLPGVTLNNSDQVYMFLPSTGGRDTYQIYSSALHEEGGRLSLPHRKLLLNTQLQLFATDWLTSDTLTQTFAWTERDPARAGLVDGDYGQIDISYELIDQATDGTVLSREYATLNYGLLSLDVTTVVPIPSAAWLFGSGLMSLASAGRRRARAENMTA